MGVFAESGLHLGYIVSCQADEGEEAGENQSSLQMSDGLPTIPENYLARTFYRLSVDGEPDITAMELREPKLIDQEEPLTEEQKQAERAQLAQFGELMRICDQLGLMNFVVREFVNPDFALRQFLNLSVLQQVEDRNNARFLSFRPAKFRTEPGELPS